jgi:CDP-6-deoxy-D-xylo-4-hexulose-3-dehydrase
MAKQGIKLIEDTIDQSDIDQLIEWLKTYPRLTKGQLTVDFETKFANWIGCKHAVFVNSGSSANLLMLYALIAQGRLKNQKIVVPSLSWATDLAPVMQLGLTPILVDCNLENLSIDLDSLELIFKQEDPAAMILVSVLGLSPDMERIVALCEQYNVILLEDNCESQGTSFKSEKLGNFGLMSSFSTYFGHTMSTIEGGLVTTNDTDTYNTLLQLRSHGWDRDLSPELQSKLRSEWKVDDFSALYTFYLPGFNLRSTDLQAFIGLGQLNKVDSLITARNRNFKLFESLLSGVVWFPKEQKDSFTASFCIPVIFDSADHKQKAIKLLRDNNIECRPLISGCMGTQPFYTRLFGIKDLPNCRIVDSRGMYIPNHPSLSYDDITLMCRLVAEASGKKLNL